MENETDETKDKSMSVFKIDLPPNMTDQEWSEFQSIMDNIQEQTLEYCQKLAQELKVSIDCASDIVYLRSRSRWTPQLEATLIRLHQEGTPPNVYEFGN